MTPLFAAEPAAGTDQNGRHLLEGVEGDVEVARRLPLADLRRPVDLLEDKLDRFAASIAAVDDVALVVDNDGGRGRAGGLQLQLQTAIS